MPSSTEQNYLKAILQLTGRTGEPDRVSPGLLARELAVTPGTVTPMMKQLARTGLVTYEPRRGVALTRAGRRAAVDILRRHRLVELFLVNVMGMDWADVHDEAEELEHVVSDRVVARMDAMLGHPTHDPHGAPIPTATGATPRRRAKRLAQCVPGRYRLVEAPDRDRDFLGWMSERGLTVGAGFTLEAIDRPGAIVTLTVPGRKQPVCMGLDSAARLRVMPAA